MADTTKEQPTTDEEEGATEAAADLSPEAPPDGQRRSHSTAERIEQLRDLKTKAALGGGPEAVERQHARGKLTARERLELLLDPGSFVETDMLTRHRFGTYGLDNQRPYT